MVYDVACIGSTRDVVVVGGICNGGISVYQLLVSLQLRRSNAKVDEKSSLCVQ